MSVDYLLLETGDKLVLEDGSGDLLLETSGAGSSFLSWFLYYCREGGLQVFKNVASQKVSLLAFDSATGLPKTGDAGNITFYYNGDDGGVTVFSTGSGHPSEDDATNSKGMYTLAVTQGETDYNKIAFSGKSGTSGIVVVPVVIYTVPANFSTLAITSGGVAQADVQTIKTQAVTCAAGVTILANVGASAAAGSANGMLIAGSNAATTFAGLTTGALACTTITASGAVAFQSTFAVTTSTALAALSCTTLTASGAVVFQSTFAVTTSTALAALSATTVTFSGAVAFQSTFIVTGAVTFSSTFATTGTTTFNALTVTNATTLSGAVSLGSTLGVTGTTTLAALTLTGTMTVNAFVCSNNFTVTGNWLTTGTTTWTGAAAFSGGLTSAVVGNITGNLSGSVGSVTSAIVLPANPPAGFLVAASFATDSIAAAAVKADAVTKIQAGLSTYAGGDTSGTTTLLGRIGGSITISGGIVSADTVKINGSATAAALQALAARAIYSGTVTGSPTTTTFVDTSAVFADNDQVKGRIILFWNAASLNYEGTDITSFNASTTTLGFSVLTRAPTIGDAYLIV